MQNKTALFARDEAKRRKQKENKAERRHLLSFRLVLYFQRHTAKDSRSNRRARPAGIQRPLLLKDCAEPLRRRTQTLRQGARIETQRGGTEFHRASDCGAGRTQRCGKRAGCLPVRQYAHKCKLFHAEFDTQFHKLFQKMSCFSSFLPNLRFLLRRNFFRFANFSHRKCGDGRALLL